MLAIRSSLLSIVAAAFLSQAVFAQDTFSNNSTMDPNYQWPQTQFVPMEQPIMPQPANLFDKWTQNPYMPNPSKNSFSMQNVLRAILGETPTSSGDAAKRSNAEQQVKNAAEQQALGSVRSDLQIALDQASQAENDCGRATYGEKSSRLSAAYSAQCHADTASGAADRAAGTAYGKGSTASDVASQARNAANRAQAAADRARYNASVSN